MNDRFKTQAALRITTMDRAALAEIYHDRKGEFEVASTWIGEGARRRVILFEGYEGVTKATIAATVYSTEDKTSIDARVKLNSVDEMVAMRDALTKAIRKARKGDNTSVFPA